MAGLAKLKKTKTHAVTLTITMSDGSDHIIAFGEQKLSKSGKPNQFSGQKVTTKDGSRFQFGANLTAIVAKQQ